MKRRTKRVMTASAVGLMCFSLLLTARASYPPLPDLDGADIIGEAGVLVYLHRDGVLVDASDGLHALGDRPLEIGFDGLSQIAVSFILDAQDTNAIVFITRDGEWTDTIGVRGGSFDYIIRPCSVGVYAFEIANSGQQAPAKADIVLVPIEDGPDPR